MKRFFWVVTVLLAIIVAYIPVAYLINGVPDGFLEGKDPDTLRSRTWWTFLYIHMISGGIAIIIGWIQFSKKIQTNFLKWHRNTGKVYLVSSLICALSGFFIGFYATGGWIAAMGFIMVAGIYFYTTLMGYLTIRKGRVDLHQNYMTYSYAVCLAAVTLRIWIPLSYVFTDDYEFSYRIIAWMAWIPNLGVAYWINRIRE